MNKPPDIDKVSFSVDKSFNLEPCTDYVVTIGSVSGAGAAQMERWDGIAWKSAAESDGSTSQVFIVTTPPSGRIRFNVSAGTVIVSAKPKAPTFIRNF